jgi:hypothetical protein
MIVALAPNHLQITKFMSFKCEFKVADKTFEVIECLPPFSQRVKPASGVQAEVIELILQGTDDGTLGTWMANPTKRWDGTITYFGIDQHSRFKEIDFEGACMVTFLKYFTPGNMTADILAMTACFLRMDIDANDVADGTLKRSLIRLLNSQQRTGASSCMLVTISAEKLKIEGVEHQN